MSTNYQMTQSGAMGMGLGIPGVGMGMGGGGGPKSSVVLQVPDQMVGAIVGASTPP
jgi:hypothetical protein|eukprot:SAG25_NODE_439_length_7992_cov_12.738376_6_plen_56_part_00